MKTSKNTILITGGATGIGFALAEEFLRRDNQVIICGRRQNRLQAAAEKLPGLVTRVCDVASEKERVELVEWATSNFPALNVVINNAGIQRDVDFLNLEDDWAALREEISVNLDAPIHLSALFLPHMQNQPESSIINVSSGLGITPSSRVPIYCSTKSALHTFTKTFRHQVRNTSVSVYEVIPPAVDSELNYESRIKRGFLKTGVTAKEFAEAVIKELEAGHVEIGYGSTLKSKTASRAELDEIFRRMNP